ncbi:MAG: 4-hydroxythreonine-4-phosphate dehydrogenase PdxA [Alphaproteobacteria bacterium]|nr:4-hydroxythreonine-4-phosphate dehydrogenase PdxA [Alphaproteobacteria bacterium]
MKPLGITMGDPSGVGPEIICRALAALPAELRAGIVVIGDPDILARANDITGAAVRFGDGDGVRIIAVDTPEKDTIRDGEISPGGGHAAYGYVVKAVEMAKADEISVIITAPLNKAALHRAGHKYDGHTGLIQHLCGAPSSFMLLYSEALSCIHVSTHVSLAEAIARTRKERVLETIRAGNAHFRRLGVEKPRIACAGLNPHCGEGGLFGDEDTREIVPAIEAAQAEGIAVSGPYPPDTVFFRAHRGEFDLVVANYHDQGHIPTKLIAFETTVNVSLGLPVQRASVDHGTAFDIAWTGKADHTNMLAALAYGRRIAEAPSLETV